MFFETIIYCVILALFKEVALCVMHIIRTVMRDNKTIRMKHAVFRYSQYYYVSIFPFPTVITYLGVVYLWYMLYFKMSCVYCCSCLVCVVVVVLCVLL